MFVKIFTAFFLAGLVAAGPLAAVEKRLVPNSNCTTIRSGILRTTNGHLVTISADGFVTMNRNTTSGNGTTIGTGGGWNSTTGGGSWNSTTGGGNSTTGGWNTTTGGGSGPGSNSTTGGGNLTTIVEFQSCQPNFGGYDGKKGRPTGGHIYLPQFQTCLTVPQPDVLPLTVSTGPCETLDDSRQTLVNWIEQTDRKIYFIGGTHADRSNVFHGKTCGSGYFGVKSNTTSGPLQLNCVNDGHVIGFNV